MPMPVGVDSALIYRGQRLAAHTQELTPSIYREGMTLRRNEEQGAEKDDKGISMPKPALFAVGYMESDWVRYAIQDERGAVLDRSGLHQGPAKSLCVCR